MGGQEKGMDSLVLVIGNKNYSSWSLRAWLLLKQLDIPFSEVRIPLDTHTWRREIREHSPSQMVPALKDGEHVVWDSLAICEYLSEQFGDGRGWPQSVQARAAARSVSAEMHAGFAALRQALPMNCRRRVAGFRAPEEAAGNIRRIFQVWRWCRETWGSEGAFLFGDFCIADAMYAPVVSRFKTYGVPTGPVENAYMDAVVGLDAMQEWLLSAAKESEVIHHAEVLA
jgi:glutathione S-transferase